MIGMRPVGLRWRQADLLLAGSAVALTAYGVVLVASASWHYYVVPSLLSNSWFLKQTLFAGLGIGAMLFCASLHPRVIRAVSYPIYGCSLLALLAVLFIGRGSADYGAQRWVEFAGIPLQPSEPAKIALVLVLARLFADRPIGVRAILGSAALTAAPFALIYAQPDLATGLLLLVIWFGMLVLAGTPTRYLGALAALAIIAAPVAWLGLKDYMRERILSFLNPQADALGQGYNILQAEISIGSGGMLGKGLLEGTQTQLRFLPVSHSDFIFAVLGEELGFMGAMLLFALFLILLFRLLRNYDVAEDRFSRLICAGVVSLIAFQAIANLGANLGLTPVAGIPLPLVSYGGSALVTQLAALGLVQAHLLRRRQYRFEV